jgi:hypothetical protein
MGLMERNGDKLVWSDTRQGEGRCLDGKGFVCRKGMKSHECRKEMKSWNNCWLKTARRGRDQTLGMHDRAASCRRAICIGLLGA